MTKPVLGRDPFSKPAPAAPGRRTGRGAAASGKKATPGKKSRPKKKTKRKSRPKAPEELKERSAPAAGQVEPIRISDEDLERRKFDRVELLEGAKAKEGSFENLLHSSTRFVRPSFYGEKLGKVHMRYHAEEIDPFGFDPVYWDKVEPFFEFLYDNYWRVEMEGIEKLPDEGRLLLVGNHSGTLPYDGAMLKVAIENHHPHSRAVRFLVEDFVFHFPFLGAFMNRIGGVRACQDNARRLLDDEQLLVVFPEGVKGIGKLFSKRYKLQRFGRGGFIKLALRTQSPIQPVAIVGAEEIHPMLASLRWLARPLGLPYLPVTPTFPWLGPLGAVPLPSKWMMRFGEVVSFDEYSPEDADDPLTVMKLAESVRSTIQDMVDELLKKRQGAFG